MSTADDVVSDLVVTPPGTPLPHAAGLLADTTGVAAVGVLRSGRRGARLVGAVMRAVPIPRPSATSRAGRAVDDVAIRAAEARRSVEAAASGLLDRVVPMA